MLNQPNHSLPVMLPTTKILFSLYVLIRFLSLITYHHPLANQIIAGAAVIVFGYICLKNLKLGWLLLVGELLLDGAGHFFELQSLLLRTWWLGIFGLIWFIGKLKQKDFGVTLPRPILISLIGLGILVVWSIFNGFLHNHRTTNILQDAILFCFLMLIFPALEFGQETKKPLSTVIKTWIVGSMFFSGITFLIYSSGLGNLPDTYYHWFRNIAAGKITDLGNNFFRIVLPEHLFIVPIILVIVAYLIHQPTLSQAERPKNKKLWGLLLCSLFILTLNFSRIYFLALAAGLLVLAFKHPLKRWFVISTMTVLSSLIIFSFLSLSASRGQSMGLELLGLRVSGTTALQTDTSGAIRLAMLPDIFRQLKSTPWLGSGLGATVMYIDPVTKEVITRTQFDWGYLEMLAEMGIVGTTIFFLFFFTAIYRLARHAYSSINTNPAFVRGLLAGAIALLIINITTPALFHGFGILYIVLILVVIHRNRTDILTK